ncbi:E3 ubiquitin/ISG15 ligase TRIM25-like [Mantella aurantiaca]
MASAELRDELSCSICLNIYAEPESLRCGHSFCRDCIGRVLEVQKDSGGYSCPECREEYAERPVLEKNRKLCNIAKHFLVTQTRPEESQVACTYCVHAPVSAAKTCLQCETSLCEVHLRIHDGAVDHVLVEPTHSLADRKCQSHNKLLEYHCCEDAACVCVSCFAVGPHRTHQVETLEEAMAKKKEKVRQVLDALTSQVGVVDKQFLCLLELQAAEHRKADGSKKRVAAVFEDARKQLEEKEAWILDVISEQEDEIVSEISYLMDDLEERKELLLEKIRHLEELGKMADPLLVLRDKETDSEGLVALEELGKAEELVDEEDISAMRFDEGLVAASLHMALSDFASKVKRAYHKTEAVNLSLDSDTAANHVLVSVDRKLASWVTNGRNRSARSTRFASYCQVLTKNSFHKGQYYWEVDTSELAYWMVGLAYASIPREGPSSKIGSNESSWCLYKSGKGYRVIHDSVASTLYIKPPVKRLGVYLDYEAGFLSFYQLGDSAEHLHTFQSTFTEPLHLAFFIRKEGWIRIKS